MKMSLSEKKKKNTEEIAEKLDCLVEIYSNNFFTTKIAIEVPIS